MENQDVVFLVFSEKKEEQQISATVHTHTISGLLERRQASS